MRLTSKGQVTIPLALRERLGLLPNTEVQFTLDGEGVRITKARGSHRRGEAVVARLRGRATSRLSTDEILSLTRR
jgi:AbrB family looped-hinge helix DNA binding protein